MQANEFNEALLNRRSLRALATNPIPREMTMRMLEAARWAPSCSNSQPWRFVVVEEEPVLTAVKSALKPGNQKWASTAPMIIVVCAKPEDDFLSFGQPLYLFDCGLATENLLLQGVAEGLVMHPMAGWEEEPMKAAIGLPDPYRVVCVIASGFPGQIENLDIDLQEREKSPRIRKPLEEIAVFGAWPED